MSNNYKMQLLANAVTDALREMQSHPDDDIQGIWNEKLTDWETGLRMNSDFTIDPSL